MSATDDERLTGLAASLARDDPRFARSLDEGRPAPPREYRRLRGWSWLAVATAALIAGVVLPHGLLLAAGLGPLVWIMPASRGLARTPPLPQGRGGTPSGVVVGRRRLRVDSLLRLAAARTRPRSGQPGPTVGHGRPDPNERPWSWRACPPSSSTLTCRALTCRVFAGGGPAVEPGGRAAAVEAAAGPPDGVC
ncbi:DUF3040 domain-containing protein [Streptomyces bobili]|uniref:DUF3040 domain-containing protein n=1 Tax=Streptomyces bobili TaxID=67280 RepID=UPI0037B61CBA